MNQMSRVSFVARVATDLWLHMVTFSNLLIAFYPKAASFFRSVSVPPILRAKNSFPICPHILSSPSRTEKLEGVGGGFFLRPQSLPHRLSGLVSPDEIQSYSQ